MGILINQATKSAKWQASPTTKSKQKQLITNCPMYGGSWEAATKNKLSSELQKHAAIWRESLTLFLQLMMTRAK
jgi:hypothetical protein